MFANSQMGGVDTGFPDVCLTPAPPAPAPVPIPYPNITAGPMGVPPVTKVLFMCTPAHNMGTKIRPTNGDNPGVNMGVASGSVMMTSRHTTGAFTVILSGKPATRMTSMAMQNTTNCPPGARIAPGQTKVILLAP